MRADKKSKNPRPQRVIWGIIASAFRKLPHDQDAAYKHVKSLVRKSKYALKDAGLLWTLIAIKPLEECINESEFTHPCNLKLIPKYVSQTHLAEVNTQTTVIGRLVARLIDGLRQESRLIRENGHYLMAFPFERLIATLARSDINNCRPAIRAAMLERSFPCSNRQGSEYWYVNCKLTLGDEFSNSHQVPPKRPRGRPRKQVPCRGDSDGEKQ